MRKNDIAALRQSWAGADNTGLVGHVLRALRQRVPFEDLAVGRSGDRVDLRGLPLAPRMLDLRGRTVVGVDLSAAALPEARLHDTTFDDCVFDHADLSSLVQWNSTYRRCSFRGTSFHGASFGADGALFEDCRFDRAVFRGASFIRPRFVGCEFTNCRLTGVDFGMSAFVDCRFQGRLDDVRFNGHVTDPVWTEAFGPADPNPMARVDLSRAVLSYVSFNRHCDLSTVTPPTDGRHALLRHLRRAVELAEEEITVSTDAEILDGAGTWLPTLKALSVDQDHYIVSQADFEADGTRFAAYLMELLVRCDARAATT